MSQVSAGPLRLRPSPREGALSGRARTGLTHPSKHQYKKAKAMKGMKRRAMRKKKKAAAPEEAPMKAMRRK